MKVRLVIIGIIVFLIVLCIGYFGAALLDTTGRDTSATSMEYSNQIAMESLKTTQIALASVNHAVSNALPRESYVGLIIGCIAFLAMILIACKIPGCNDHNEVRQRPERIYVHILPNGDHIEGKLVEAPKQVEYYQYPNDIWEQRQMESRW